MKKKDKEMKLWKCLKHSYESLINKELNNVLWDFTNWCDQ